MNTMNVMGRGTVSELVLREDDLSEIEGGVTTFAVIDSRKLERECFVRVISGATRFLGRQDSWRERIWYSSIASWE
jgi:hypothetical protein